jgi:heme-degrading monooxygenase HmoA
MPNVGTYMLMVVHHPEDGRHDDVYQRMCAFVPSMEGTPGLLEIGAWQEHGGQRVVGLSRWESREAFEAAMPGGDEPDETIQEGESRPREYFHLQRVAALTDDAADRIWEVAQ